MQPNFSWDVENYQVRLGEDIKKLNPFREILDRGVSLAFGSDDMPSGPLTGIAWAVAKAPFAHQRITLEEAISAYTAAPATIAGMGRVRGKIAVGMEANFAVLEKNPFTIAPSEIGNISMKTTWIKGKKFLTNA